MIKNIKFEELSLSNETLRALKELNFSEAFPIQAQAIPPLLEGHDLIGQAMTGTGKTMAFGLPAIEKIDPENRAVQVLILCPTRELAVQVSVEITKVIKYKKNLYALPIYGGQPIERQLQGLRRNPQIIIGTPGRIKDHMRRGTLRLNGVKMIILDEADEMLDRGFRADIELILKSLQPTRQTVLFSATMSREILELTKRYQTNPTIIKIVQEPTKAPAVEQMYYEVESSTKTDALISLIDHHGPRLSIVFCNTKRKVDEITKQLRAKGFLAEGLHGDIRQAKRDAIMSRFRNDKVTVLVATDVAARGIDVANVEAVFNYEIPQDEKFYVHRIGRTGRAGKTGKAFSLVSRRELYKFRDIERFTKLTATRSQIPGSGQRTDLNSKSKIN
jgi:ATP-dependent RNA helicase DeaD